VNSMNVAQDSG